LWGIHPGLGKVDRGRAWRWRERKVKEKKRVGRKMLQS